MGADPAEIRRAYVRLARRHHPDAHSGAGPQVMAGAEARMQEINAAWTVLGDPVRRRRYDDAVRAGIAERPAGPRPAGRSGPAATPWHPLADDTAWMDDFATWRDDTDDLVPPDAPRSPARRALMVLPVALFVTAVAVGCLAMVLQARPLLALSFLGVALASALFFLLPILEMAGRRGR